MSHSRIGRSPNRVRRHVTTGRSTDTRDPRSMPLRRSVPNRSGIDCTAETSSFSARFIRAYSYVGAFFLSSLLILIAGHSLIGLYISLRHHGETDPRASLPVYANFPDREQLWKDFAQFSTEFEPYIHWRWSPLTTKHVNIEPTGLRRTVKQPHLHAKKVFVMGGSTVWGTGAPDAMTIPSFLQAALGPDYDVYNFGGTGYVTTQELNQLLKALSNGDVPDYVIFYDGNNDGYAGTYSPAIPRDPQNVRKRA